MRRIMKRSYDRRRFAYQANRTNVQNVRLAPRGGIRL